MTGGFVAAGVKAGFGGAAGVGGAAVGVCVGGVVGCADAHAARASAHWGADHRYVMPATVHEGGGVA